MASVTLSDGREIELREPMAGELRGIKLLDVLQLDVSAHAELVPRISEMERAQFLALNPRDAIAIMTENVGFFAPSALEEASQPVSRMPGK